MKKIDKFLVTSFIAPFVATFFISMFVLIMQFLWLYIDDIIGKGVGLLMISELLFYSSCSLIPTALPIAVLISSVMVFGNLAEHYELASLKSAGIPLLRVMMPIFYVTLVIACASYLFSNNIIPITNLKSKSTLYDIRKSKATLSLEEGIFNEDFKGIVIHIGKKEKDEKTIRDVLIYNHDHKYQNRLSVITAKRGEMYISEDKRYFIMNLYEGVQYQEPEPAKGKDKADNTFSRTYFKEWNKVFDLSEFDIQDTDEERFKNNYTMLSFSQLMTAIDSLDKKIADKYTSVGDQLKRHFQPTKLLVEKSPNPDADDIDIKEKKPGETPDREDEPTVKGAKKTVNSTDTDTNSEESSNDAPTNKPVNTPNSDSGKNNNTVTNKASQKDLKNRAPEKKPISKPKPKPDKPSPPKKNAKPAVVADKASPQADKKAPAPAKMNIVQDSLTKAITAYGSFMETIHKDKHKRYIDKAKSYARGIRDQADGAITSLNHTREVRVKHIYELNLKFSMAVICIIFLFIGGPMGAIVRKGGFGYPVLIAIFFFVIFMILNIFFKKLAETFVIAPELAPWMPCLILMPFGFFLTYRAMNDRRIINTDGMERIFLFVKRLFIRKTV